MNPTPLTPLEPEMAACVPPTANRRPVGRIGGSGRWRGVPGSAVALNCVEGDKPLSFPTPWRRSDYLPARSYLSARERTQPPARGVNLRSHASSAHWSRRGGAHKETLRSPIAVFSGTRQRQDLSLVLFFFIYQRDHRGRTAGRNALVAAGAEGRRADTRVAAPASKTKKPSLQTEPSLARAVVALRGFGRVLEFLGNQVSDRMLAVLSKGQHAALLRPLATVAKELSGRAGKNPSVPVPGDHLVGWPAVPIIDAKHVRVVRDEPVGVVNPRLAPCAQVFGLGRSVGVAMHVERQAVGKLSHLPAGLAIILANPVAEILRRPSALDRQELFDAVKEQEPLGVLVAVVVMEQRPRRLARILPDEVEVGSGHVEVGKKM